MREIREVHYKIIKFMDEFYKVYLPTENNEERTWTKWQVSNWIPVEDEDLIFELNQVYHEKIER